MSEMAKANDMSSNFFFLLHFRVPAFLIGTLGQIWSSGDDSVDGQQVLVLIGEGEINGFVSVVSVKGKQY